MSTVFSTMRPPFARSVPSTVSWPALRTSMAWPGSTWIAAPLPTTACTVGSSWASVVVVPACSDRLAPLRCVSTALVASSW
ncbi:hypothetical protein FQZ97_488600 [compost metagenome]